MAKLTKAQARMHALAQARLAQTSPLTPEDVEFVLEHWQEGASYLTTTVGAYFTPLDLAADAALEVNGEQPTLRVLDLCAGIGNMALGVETRYGNFRKWRDLPPIDYTCVELNPDYVAVGRKVLPQAEWITSDVFNLPPDLGHFDVVIANPPFGRTPKRTGVAPRYTGPDFDLAVVDIAAEYATEGVFILPATSTPFAYSGVPYYRYAPSAKVDAFLDATGFTLDMGAGVDTTTFARQWHGVSPRVEIVRADFTTKRPARTTQAPALFDLAAA